MTIPSSGPRTERGRGPEHPVQLERVPAGADAHKRVTDGGSGRCMARARVTCSRRGAAWAGRRGREIGRAHV